MGDDTKRLRELLAEATPGPWAPGDDGWIDANEDIVCHGPDAQGGHPDHVNWASEADRELVIALRNQAEEILEAVEERDALRAEVARLREALRYYYENCTCRALGECCVYCARAYEALGDADGG